MEEIEKFINENFKDKFNESDLLDIAIGRNALLAATIIIAEKYIEQWNDHVKFVKYMADLVSSYIPKLDKEGPNDSLWIAMTLLKICAKQLRNDKLI